MRTLLLTLSVLAILTSCGSFDTRQGDVIYLRNNGNDMPAYIYGNVSSGNFVLVLHGGPGGNGLEYRGGRYAEILEEKVAMIYWDQRGQGNSRGNKHGEELDIGLLNDDLDKLVLLLKNQYGQDINLFLFGHSWGGTYGTSYLMSETRQKQFAGWIEADGAHDIPKLNKEAIKAFISIGEDQIAKEKNTSEWQEIVDFAKGVDTTKHISDDDGGSINSYAYKAEGLLDEVKEDAGGGIRVTMWNSALDPVASNISGNYTSNKLTSNGIEEIALTDSLYKLKLPCLFLWGKYDFVVPPQLGIDGKALAGTPDKELVIYESSGHSPMNAEPEQFSSDILRFIEKYAK